MMTEFYLLLKANVGSKELSNVKCLLRKKLKKQLKGGILLLGQKYLSNSTAFIHYFESY